MTSETISCIVEVGSAKPDESDEEEEQEHNSEFKPLHLQFCPWLIQQISSGNYLDLEWLDAEEKSLFKIPWTKKFYPHWEEHHEIFRAWAAYRGKHAVETLSLCQMKSNFRTILRKCGVIEEVPNAHQLGLQTGNYKVYKVLNPQEAQEKKIQMKEELKTRKPPKKRKRRNQTALSEVKNKKSSQKNQPINLEDDNQRATQKLPKKIMEREFLEDKVQNNDNAISPLTEKFGNTNPNVSVSTKSTPAEKDDMKKNDISIIEDTSGMVQLHKTVLTKETFMKPKKPQAFHDPIQIISSIKSILPTENKRKTLSDSEPTPPQLGAFVEAISVELENDPINHQKHPKAPPLYYLPPIPQSEEKKTLEDEKYKYDLIRIPLPNPGGPVHGFQMLLDAAQIAEENSNQAATDKEKYFSDAESVVHYQPKRTSEPSIVDILLELKIPPEELFAYELHVKYETKHILDSSLDDMSHGYRIFYGNTQEFIKQNGNSNMADDFSCTPIKLPESQVPPGNSLYTVLKNMHPGLIVKSDKTHTLYGKRLCQSRIFTFTSYGDVDADKEPMNMTNGQNMVLFSYKSFMNDWRQFLIEGHPYPNIEVNCSFGKKPKQRHSRVFVSITIIPKAAKTMMQRISSVEEKGDLESNSQDSTFDNILKMFFNS
uniref:Interferon regulatory factor like protein n=1 Tax=Phallusia mammillata TaxID=59560 RepID=A0A6F9DES8_9ASCI|nr:interferon regulatory factor like protein [Phallusia mammillata]